MQKGMKARNGHGDKLVDMERVVIDFHQFLAARLFGADATPHYDNPEGTVFHQTGK
ncbi:MAG: hypothetical protein GY875_01490 [Gammaproteobacteria bacterium]|nr:hypothetical protein [Gammaproteobacteria bacterium]